MHVVGLLKMMLSDTSRAVIALMMTLMTACTDSTSVMGKPSDRVTRNSVEITEFSTDVMNHVIVQQASVWNKSEKSVCIFDFFGSTFFPDGSSAALAFEARSSIPTPLVSDQASISAQVRYIPAGAMTQLYLRFSQLPMEKIDYSVVGATPIESGIFRDEASKQINTSRYYVESELRYYLCSPMDGSDTLNGPQDVDRSTTTKLSDFISIKFGKTRIIVLPPL
jgi:hypothetical protein